MTGLTGTASLARLALRRDRVVLLSWLLGLTALTAYSAVGFAKTLTTQQDVVKETAMMAGNAGIRMVGLPSGANVGAYTMVRIYVTLAILAGLMSTLAVVRHTRQGEETGRAELVGAAVVGRFASMAAALVVTVGANLALAALLGLSLIASGQPVAGSVIAGTSVAAVGIAFAAVAAVTAQLSSSSRTANGLAAAAIGLAFMLSGVGNMLGTVDQTGLRVTSAWPAWLSPIGWGQQTRPFAGDDWWPLLVFVPFVGAGLGVARFLAGRRDIGRGVLAERRGHASATPGLLTPFGLVWRLQRGALLGWAVGMVGFGLVFGAISGDVTDLGGSAAEWYSRMGGSDQIVDAYLASVMAMGGMAVAIYVVQMLLRMRAEEAAGSLESVLATAVSRPRWAMSHVLNAWLGASGLMLALAVSMGLTAGALPGSTLSQVGTLIGAALVQLPAIFVLGGGVIAVTGLLPRWTTALSWVLLMVAILLGPLFGGATLRLPQWVQNVSPLTHTPKLPAVELSPAPVVVLLAISVVLAGAGLVALHRRNLALPA